MDNDELDKSLADAMGDIPAQEQPAEAAPAAPKSTSKRTLKGPMVAEKQEDAPVISEPVHESFAELKLRAKLEVLMELLAEERATKRVVLADNAKAKVDAEPEEIVTFQVNLPKQATNIRLDGNEYYHGLTYRVPKRQAVSMRDIQFNAWKHDEQVRGERDHQPGYHTSDMSINGNGQAISRRIY